MTRLRRKGSEVANMARKILIAAMSITDLGSHLGMDADKKFQRIDNPPQSRNS
jgi:hypothetical protein